MKTPFFFLLASLLSLSALAQNDLRKNTTPEQRAEHQTRQLTKQLGLSTEQSQRLQALNLRWAQTMNSLRTEGARPERGSLRAMQQSHEADLKAVLTPEQWTTYERLRAERREKLRERRSTRPERGR
jgi:hypothetical protein